MTSDASRIGLKKNNTESKILSLMGQRSLHVEGVDHFALPKNVVSTDGGTEMDDV